MLVAENVAEPDKPFVYKPVEFRFPAGESFKHFDLKWLDYGNMQCVPCRDPELEGELREASRRLFVGLNGTGYGRCDIRVDAGGNIHVLEINPNCGIFYPPGIEGSADFILLNDPAGHAGFAEAIFAAAERRAEEHSRRYEVRYVARRGYGLFAAASVPAGAVVLAYENTPHVIVSKSYAVRTWSRREADWFGHYAYPLTDELYVSWAKDPADWRPINHSCDPNAWLTGLDVTARRPIAAGEEITIDYATFCDESMSPFACSCGAATCRGLIRGSDYREEFVDRYGDHVSDFVRAKRAALKIGAGAKGKR